MKEEIINILIMDHKRSASDIDHPKSAFQSYYNSNIKARETDRLAGEMDVNARGTETIAGGMEIKARETDILARGMEIIARGTEIIAREIEINARETEIKVPNPGIFAYKKHKKLKGVHLFSKMCHINRTGMSGSGINIEPLNLKPEVKNA